MWPKMILKSNTVQKMKFSMKYFCSKCDHICRKPQIWSHLLKKSLIENFIFCAVKFLQIYLKICTLVKMKVLNTNLTLVFKDLIFKI